MSISTIRSFFILVSSVVGYYVGTLLVFKYPLVLGMDTPMVCTMIGCVSGLIIVLLEMRLERVSMSGLSSIVFGLVLGIIMAKLLSGILSLLPLPIFVLSITEIILTIIFAYLGVVMALRGKDEFNLIIPYVRFKRQSIDEKFVLLDTSAIIDGRVNNIYKTHFLSGRLVIPRSVLLELQKLADSENDLKRQRGRRGLDLIQSMQEDPKVEIRIHEDDVSADVQVDTRLVQLAKAMDASICTTDYNLTQVASMQNVDILNINELADASKTFVFTGDVLDIKLTKEGKEADQAVGYLDDGTMVVVSHARDKLGQTKKVKVTSVLQTQSGKMVFGKLQ